MDPLKVSEYSLKQNENMSIYIKVLLLTYFYYKILNVLRLTFFNIYDLPFLRFPNIGKIWAKLGFWFFYSKYGFKIPQNTAIKNDNLLIQKLWNTFGQHSVRNVCANFKLDRVRRSRNRACQVFTTQKSFLGKIPLAMKTAKWN